ncbi:heavy-metal-associated domain-containing protein [Wansuia hejianensis]|uniref:Heavy-metal-associated domain-containing protein n=1 Tax=Wansuia hejianensis TaxID=2763667 RepID=A0A926IM85_9FIRM|nr:cation transporter [Wansuia hejianensis]MBC8590356.1 heavy-metal-associated domain-containing protein [Wansuia hejianensis]
MVKILTVEGMSCGHCEAAVKKALGELEEVRDVQVDLGSKKVEVHGEGLVDEKLKTAIEDAGYDLVKID